MDIRLGLESKTYKCILLKVRGAWVLTSLIEGMAEEDLDQ